MSIQVSQVVYQSILSITLVVMDQHRGVSLFLHGFGKTLVQEGVIVKMKCDRVRKVLKSGYGGNQKPKTSVLMDIQGIVVWNSFGEGEKTLFFTSGSNYPKTVEQAVHASVEVLFYPFSW